MRTVQLLLFGLLVCHTMESLNDKHVILGENVTLDCQIDVKDIYWVFQKLTDSPVLIMRTFSSDSRTAQLHDKRLKDKYSSLTFSRLFISNVTTEELGIYYCAKTGTPLQLSNGTRLHTTEAARDHNQTELKNNLQCPNTQQSLIVLYFIPNTVMFLAIIGLLQLKLQACKKRHQQCQNEELEQFYSTNDEEFSEVEFRPSCPTNIIFVPYQKPQNKT
ncbi:uncharacterized protein LOC127153674 [Labeo rohita]|uniref:uncharacterized protein LOC127153674 n=1 Tax=Labeo rohita TaxID=84645 RepID=UPI0021E2BD29|nr:uncharacterized protein LOC127153674 [Labeo rohita]